MRSQIMVLSLPYCKFIAFVLIASILSQTLVSCSSSSPASAVGKKYRYAYRLNKPIESPNLIYRDDQIIIQFRIDEGAVNFQLQNVSSSTMQIRWEKISIGVEGRFSSIRNFRTFYAETAIPASSHIIPPLGYTRDLVTPQENVYFDGTKWVEKELFPTVDRNVPSVRQQILQNVGNKIVLILPLQFDQVVKDYRFEFLVTAVRELPWKQYQSPKRPASPQVGSPKTSIEPSGQLTTALIVLGMIGLAAYLITLKKEPPSE